MDLPQSSDLTEKLANAKKQKQETEALRNKRRGIYRTWSETESYSDFIEFLDRTIGAFENSSKKGIGTDGDGKTVPLTSDQRLSMLDKAAGLEIARDYIKNLIS